MTDTARELQVQKKHGGDVELAQDQPVYSPATDIYEKRDAILVLCDMPGVDEKNVDITLENGVLTIIGSQAADDREGYELLYRGYGTGAFRRSFSLATDIDHARISAKIANGILHVLLPKSEETKPRRITVEAGP